LPPKESQHQPPFTETDVGITGSPTLRAPDRWWKSFDDPQLDLLIERALSESPSLAHAQARLREALAQTAIARAGLFPKARLDTSVQREHAPLNYIVSPPLAGTNFWVGQGGVSLSWDLDFWGRQADAVKQASALAQASNLDIDNAKLMLAGAVVQAYVELNRSYALMDIAIRAVAQRQDIIDITRRRLAAGIDTKLELREAEGQLPLARVARAQAQAAVDLAVHQLATICGQGAQTYASIKRPQLNPDGALPLPIDLPINLLARRPDVLAARLRVRAADAQRLAARAVFYPDISLRALAGVGAFGLSDLVEWSARGYGGGPLLSLPLFDAGRLRAQYRGSEAQLDDAIAIYNTTVLKAVQQTADQLTSIAALARERLDQQEAQVVSEDAYRIGQDQYRAGTVNYLLVLNAETQVLNARRDSVDIIANQILARVSLLLAVGGSFDPAIPFSSAKIETSAASRAFNTTTTQVVR
jgi:NodT family efflux transporter outer membrane factor (OMF) lipoprotein